MVGAASLTVLELFLGPSPLVGVSASLGLALACLGLMGLMLGMVMPTHTMLMCACLARLNPIARPHMRA